MCVCIEPASMHVVYKVRVVAISARNTAERPVAEARQSEPELPSQHDAKPLNVSKRLGA